MQKLVECVPNFSEGRNLVTINAISDVIKSVSDVKLLDVDPGSDTNRTVYTFVGTPEAVIQAAFLSAKKAFDLIDMSTHLGAHPRMGAMDVCPIIPVANVSMEEAVEYSKVLGKKIADELQVPVYFYENSASNEERKNLATIRAGEYEGLKSKLSDPHWKPDCGPSTFNKKFGAVAVGAREFLLAYNVNINSRDKKIANEIALNIREGGRSKKDADGKILKNQNGQTIKVPGKLKNVRAIGWYIDQYRQAQVSINLLNYKSTPLHLVFDTVREEAEKLGALVTGSELVGLTPIEPLIEAGKHYLKKQGKCLGAPEAELVELAIRSMGLDQVAEFDPNKKIIEYQVKKPTPLMNMTVNHFVDEVSSESPAPGGGSVSALSGSLGASLSAMVCNLTVGKKGYEAAWTELSDLAEKCQMLKKKLALAVDEDTEAFNKVMSAMRLPKITPEEQKAREQAIEEANKEAALVPMATAKLCLEVLVLSNDITLKGNKNSASDVGVAGLVARAGVEGACLNVLINLGSIKDENFKSQCRKDVERIKHQARFICDGIQENVISLFTKLPL